MRIQDIFCEFGQQKHDVLGSFTRSYFDRINGRIKISIIKDEYVKRFGDKYVLKFTKKLEIAEKESLRNHRLSIKTNYNNIITWRNGFAHEGKIPNTVTYREVTEAYIIGKNVIECLAETMRR